MLVLVTILAWFLSALLHAMPGSPSPDDAALLRAPVSSVKFWDCFYGCGNDEFVQKLLASHP